MTLSVGCCHCDIFLLMGKVLVSPWQKLYIDMFLSVNGSLDDKSCRFDLALSRVDCPDDERYGIRFDLVLSIGGCPDYKCYTVVLNCIGGYLFSWFSLVVYNHKIKNSTNNLLHGWKSTRIERLKKFILDIFHMSYRRKPYQAVDILSLINCLIKWQVYCLLEIKTLATICIT